MRKASKIIYLVGGIVSIVAAVGYLISALVFIIIPNMQTFIDGYNQGIADGTISSNISLAELQGVIASVSIPFFFFDGCSYY